MEIYISERGKGEIRWDPQGEKRGVGKLADPAISTGIIDAPSTDYTTNSTTYEFITAKRFLTIAKDGICSVWRILTKAVYVL